MTREEFLKEKIQLQGTYKDFAEKINMPDSTLRSILKNVGGAAFDNILKICKGLNITTLVLENMSQPTPAVRDQKEEELMKKYRVLSQSGKDTVEAVINIQYEATKPNIEKGKVI